MRREIGLSSFSSCLSAVRAISTFHAIAPHYFFKRNRLAASRAHFFQCLLSEVDVFEIVQVLEDCFAGVVGFGAAGALGKAVKALFDFVGKTNGEHT